MKDDNDLKFEKISNANLVCKDCAYKFDDSKIIGNVSRCAKFTLKPNYVLLGGNCEKYRKANK